MNRVYNFSAGPAMMPEEVLRQAQAELLDWQGSGMSVIEVSHRGKAFVDCAARAEASLREVLDVPDSYKVLFLQGGATMQFAGVPLNLTRPGDRVDYVVTGSWGKKAATEARKYAEVNVAADGAESKYTAIPDVAGWRVSDDAVYLHYTPNETIGGVEFLTVPEVSDAPLIVDMSSTILSRPIDVSRYGVIYAGAQKNIGPAGLAVVIVREDLVGRARVETPSVIDYDVMAKSDSMSNTPPTFTWYLAGLVFEWIKQQGGVTAMGERNQRKASKLYKAIDDSGFYRNPIEIACRSWMNVPFTLPDPALDEPFLAEAKDRGLVNLKGHRSVGGMRASLYNAMPEAGVDALIEFMRDFQARRG